MVLLGYPLSLALELIEAHPIVVDAKRLTFGKDKIPTRQVLVTLKGETPSSLDLGNWGVFSLRTYVPNPLRCFKCQRYGHHQEHCRATAKCGICSKAHLTEVCLSKFKKDNIKEVQVS